MISNFVTDQAIAKDGRKGSERSLKWKIKIDDQKIEKNIEDEG